MSGKESIWKSLESEPVPRLALSAAETAKALGVCKRTVDGLAVEGKLPSVRVGQRRLFPVAALKEWLRDQVGEEGGA